MRWRTRTAGAGTGPAQPILGARVGGHGDCDEDEDGESGDPDGDAAAVAPFPSSLPAAPNRCCGRSPPRSGESTPPEMTARPGSGNGESRLDARFGFDSLLRPYHGTSPRDCDRIGLQTCPRAAVVSAARPPAPLLRPA